MDRWGQTRPGLGHHHHCQQRHTASHCGCALHPAKPARARSRMASYAVWIGYARRPAADVVRDDGQSHGVGVSGSEGVLGGSAVSWFLGWVGFTFGHR